MSHLEKHALERHPDLQRLGRRSSDPRTSAHLGFAKPKHWPLLAFHFLTQVQVRRGDVAHPRATQATAAPREEQRNRAELRELPASRRVSCRPRLDFSFSSKAANIVQVSLHLTFILSVRPLRTAANKICGITTRFLFE